MHNVQARQGRFLAQLTYAVRTGRCPVCHKRARARWKDTGALRITCGHPECFAKWLPGKKEVIEVNEAEQLHHDEEAVMA